MSSITQSADMEQDSGFDSDSTISIISSAKPSYSSDTNGAGTPRPLYSQVLTSEPGTFDDVSSGVDVVELTKDEMVEMNSPSLLEKCQSEGVILEGLIIDCAFDLGIHNLFASQPQLTKDVQRLYFMSSKGDVFTLLNIFRKWTEQLSNSEKEASMWCKEHGLSECFIKLLHEKVNEVYQCLPEAINGTSRCPKLSFKTPYDEADNILFNIITEYYSTEIYVYSGHPTTGYVSVLGRTDNRIQVHKESDLQFLGYRPNYILKLYEENVSIRSGVVLTDDEATELCRGTGLSDDEIETFESAHRLEKIERKGIGFKTLEIFKSLWETEMVSGHLNENQMRPVLETTNANVVVYCARADIDRLEVVIDNALEKARGMLNDNIVSLQYPRVHSRANILCGNGIQIKSINSFGCTSRVAIKSLFQEYLTIDMIRSEIRKCLPGKEFSIRTGYGEEVTFGVSGIATFHSPIDAEEFVRKCSSGLFHCQLWSFTRNVSETNATKHFCFSETITLRCVWDWIYQSDENDGESSCDELEQSTIIEHEIIPVIKSDNNISLKNNNGPEQLSKTQKRKIRRRQRKESEWKTVKVKRKERQMYPKEDTTSHIIVHEQQVDQAAIVAESFKDKARTLKSRLGKILEYLDPTSFHINVKIDLTAKTPIHADIVFTSKSSAKRGLKYLEHSVIEGNKISFKNKSSFKNELKTIDMVLSKNLNRVCGHFICKKARDLSSCVPIEVKRMYSSTVHDQTVRIQAKVSDVERVDFVKGKLEEFVLSNRKTVLLSESKHEIITGECANDVTEYLITKYGLFFETKPKSLNATIYGRQNTDVIDAAISSVSEFDDRMHFELGEHFVSKIQDHVLPSRSKIDVMIFPRESRLALVVKSSVLGCFDPYGETEAIELPDMLSVPEVVEDHGYCGVCYKDLCAYSEYHVLETCGHKYCFGCLSEQMAVVQNSTQFPILCAEDNSPFTYDDLVLITKKVDILKLRNLIKCSVRSFVRANGKEFRFCVDERCDGIFVLCQGNGGDRFRCTSCGKQGCAKCEWQYHGALTCAEYAKSLGGIDNWLKADTVNRRRCPNCSIGIEKMGGCNNVFCLSCKVSVCWVCNMHFKASHECYNHLNKLHGGYM